LIALFTWLPKSRAFALLVLVMCQLNVAVVLADDHLYDDTVAHGPVVEDPLDDDELVAGDEVTDDEVTGDRLADEQLTDDNILLSVNSMPLSVFASAIEESMSISIEVDESIADFTVDGQFNGSIEYLLDDLYDRYGINHSVSGDVYELWRDTDFSSQLNYQFQLSDMDLVAFLSYLSDAAGYQLVADTSININVDGAYSGTLRDTINALSHQYPVLFYVSEDTISVVPESSFVKSVVQLTEDNYSPEAFLTDLRSKIPPGNFVNREDNQLIVGGHPDFVRRTELELQVDMTNTASLTPDLLKTQFPVILATDDNTRVDQPVSESPENSAAGVPLVLVDQPGTATLAQKTGTAESLAKDTDNAVESEPDTEIAVTPVQTDESGVPSESGVDTPVTAKLAEDVATESKQEADVDATSEQETELAATLDQISEGAATVMQDAGVKVVPERDAGDAVTAEQNAEVAPDTGDTVSAEQDAEAAPEQDTADTVSAQQDVEDAGTPEQGAREEPAAKLKPGTEGDSATAKPKDDVDSVDEIPGFY